MGGAAIEVFKIGLNRGIPMRVSVAASDRIERRSVRYRVQTLLSNDQASGWDHHGEPLFPHACSHVEQRAGLNLTTARSITSCSETRTALNLEKLAYESDLGSKGYLSDIEKGLALPTVKTLKVLAERLDVLPLDLLTDPSHDPRQTLVDRTRHLDTAAIRELLRHLPTTRETGKDA